MYEPMYLAFTEHPIIDGTKLFIHADAARIDTYTIRFNLEFLASPYLIMRGQKPEMQPGYWQRYTYYDGKLVLPHPIGLVCGFAMCNPNDTFDFETGLRVAMRKTFTQLLDGPIARPLYSFLRKLVYNQFHGGDAKIMVKQQEPKG